MGKAIFGCGVVLMVAMSAIGRLDARADSTSFLIFVAGAAAAYVAALGLIARAGGGSRRELAVCLVLALAWRLPLLISAPILSDDIYRYIWDGRVQRFGHNPYVSAPVDPALQHLQTPLTQKIDPTSAVLPTIYPPGAELFFRGVTSLHESVLAMTLAMLVCDALIVVVMLRWLVATGRNPWWVLAYAWHPLVAIEGVGGGHIDLLGTLLVVTTGLALARGRTAAAAVSLAVAVAVKFLPIVLAPLLWRRIRVRDAVLAVGVALAMYLPFMRGTAGVPIGSLGVYAEKWRFNGPLFNVLEPQLGPSGVLAAAALAGLLVAAAGRRWLAMDAPAAWAWPLATALLLMPAIYPWYLLWLTPFLTATLMTPLIAWTLSVLLTYVVWDSQLSGLGWVLPGWVVPVEYGLVAASAVGVLLVRQRPRPAVDRPSPPGRP